MAEELPYPYTNIEQPPLTPMSLYAEVAEKIIEPDQTTKDTYEMLNKDLRVGNIDEREANILINTIGYIANVKFLCLNILKFTEAEVKNMTFDKILGTHASAMLNISVSKDGFMLRNLGTVRQLIQRQESRGKGNVLEGLFKKKERWT